MLRKFFVAGSIAALAIGGSTACATKKFVRTSVGEVNDKVDSMGRSIEETQERTRQNEGKIADVDQKAGAAQQAADQAGQQAKAANSAAAAVDNKFTEFDKQNRRLVYEVVLSEDSGNFKFGKTELPDEAKQEIDQVVSQLKQDPKNVWIEIEGHTDNVGPKAVNEKIGLERAQAVERYLYEQYQIPLHKMNVISYGAEKPVAPNKTKQGRAQNRRVVIKILA
ncbi:MAG TPA: OmpA family protein [Vicinamibacterales bacterium]|nr:OmpA family protein [Vicinamibacterales bacterium]